VTGGDSHIGIGIRDDEPEQAHGRIGLRLIQTDRTTGNTHTRVDRDYDTLRADLRTLFDDLQINAAA
jgi:hypothetical protein